MHKQAAKNTLMLILSAIVAGLGIATAFSYIPVQILVYIGVASFAGYMIWIFYTMEKSRLEGLARLNKQ